MWGMARAPNEKQIMAKNLFDRGCKLIEISKELDIPEGTIRSWKNRYNWDDENNATLQIKLQLKRIVNKEAIADEVKEVMENNELTDKQRLFCIHYFDGFNAIKAYQKVYECEYSTARTNGSMLLT